MKSGLVPNMSSLLTFSYEHCVWICAVLVPANLLATLQTLIFAVIGVNIAHRRWLAGLAILYAGLLIFHVITWWLIGVVMAPTYILMVLGSVCLAINGLAIVASMLPQLPNKIALQLRVAGQGTVKR
jgi:hypothetical protein